MAPLSERAIHRVAAVQERDHRFAPGADFLERPANPEIAARGHQALFERRDRLLGPAGLLVHLGQIQIELGVIVPHPHRFLAEGFRVAISLLSDRGQQAGVGEVERVLRRSTQGAPGVEEGILCMAVAQLLETFLEVVHASIGGRRCANPVGHRLLPRPAGGSGRAQEG
jgi:hypothetical protein